MPDFTNIPEALEFLAGQAWLTPEEACPAFRPPASAIQRPPGLSWRDAMRQIAAIVSRIERP